MSKKEYGNKGNPITATAMTRSILISGILITYFIMISVILRLIFVPSVILSTMDCCSLVKGSKKIVADCVGNLPFSEILYSTN